jgi:hypothetical protein
MPDQPARGGSRAGDHDEARVMNEWQSARAGWDTMAKKAVGACDLARSPIVSRDVLATYLLSLLTAGAGGCSPSTSFELKFDFEDEGEDAPLHTQVETPILPCTPK